MYIPLLQSLASSDRASSASSSANASASANDGTGGLNTMFLQLLTAQLKAQSPIDPLDPNQFVAQLAQFQSLSALTQIDQYMQMLVADVTPPSSPGGESQSIAATNSSSIPSTVPNSSSN